MKQTIYKTLDELPLMLSVLDVAAVLASPTWELDNQINIMSQGG